jgi:hypothetical protein
MKYYFYNILSSRFASKKDGYDMTDTLDKAYYVIRPSKEYLCPFQGEIALDEDEAKIIEIMIQ